MPSSREVLERLKAADRSLSKERMPRASSRRVAKRLSRELESQSRFSPMGPSGWIPMLTFVAGAALVLLFLRWSTNEAVPVAEGKLASPAMTVLVSGPACRSQSEQTTKVWGACSISTAGPSMSIDTIEASHLEVDGRVVYLRSGSALFDVAPVQGEPIRVVIPQGEIVVVGTRFRIVVGEVRSEVELYEGRLEFRDGSGLVTPILAGQHVGFGESVSGASRAVQEAVAPTTDLPPPEEVAATRPQTSRSRVRNRAKRTDEPAMEHDAGPVIEAAEKLRRQGRYAEAASTLSAALKRHWPTRTADVLSHELGRLLERRIRDQASACAHWSKHLKRFTKTRYRARIERSMQELGCELAA
ncbi:MAG: FecR family protein, partial [Nannocystaceae bacterium]|nr:FecR family protein [Nannocystaceae bacterium]